ncbi:hypothetical protein [Planococcus sp. SSTMD024]|uniref:hypothetical protein n=1 Tax=Planococcus sp. SSTMD024 TaxID=3242163 RepID=UPI00351E908A
MKWLKRLLSKLQRIAVLALALLQPATVWAVEKANGGLFEGDGADPLITPAGYAFSIWSVIVLGTIAYAIYQLLPVSYPKTIYDRIAARSSLIFIGFGAWIWCASNEWLWTTVFIFAAMGLLLRSVFLDLLNASLASPERWIVTGTFALYYGWTTVAVFANLSSALTFYGWPVTGLLGILWQAGMLLAAAAISLRLLKEVEYQTGYYAAILWAFVAISVGSVLGGWKALPLALIAATATCLIGINGVKNYRSRNSQKLPGARHAV